MIYKQRKGKNCIEISFLKNKIQYSVKDETSEGTFDIYPETIAKHIMSYTERNEGFKNYATYLLIIGIIFAFMSIVLRISTFYPGFLIGSAIMFLLYKRSHVHYSVLESSTKKMYIIKDRTHDEIVKRIFELRNTFYKEKYLKYIPENDIESEVNKFKWLLEEEYITEKEYSSMLNEIQMQQTSKSAKKTVS